METTLAYYEKILEWSFSDNAFDFCIDPCAGLNNANFKCFDIRCSLHPDPNYTENQLAYAFSAKNHEMV
jgi:hypothetical protein